MFGLHHRGHCHGLEQGAVGRGRFGMERGWGGADGRSGGRRRMFDGEELKLLLLALLGEQPRHGYDLIREIETRSGGAYAPSPGVIYPTLTLLDEMASIEEVKDDSARKRFTLTLAGQQHLDDRRGDADRLLARLTELGADRARTDSAPIRRAMANLHMALRDALTTDPTRAHGIADILDEATRRIERGA